MEYYIRDLEDKSANGIWKAYLDYRIGATRDSQAIKESGKLREFDKGDYELVRLVGRFGSPVWKAPDGGFYKYDDQGKLVPCQG